MNEEAEQERAEFPRQKRAYNRTAPRNPEVSTRAEDSRRERRMKPGELEAGGLKLSLDENKLDRNQFQYRFAADRPGRVQQLQRQDWDVVTDDVKPDANGLGSVVTAPAGVDEGKPYNHVLMRKYKDWYKADQKIKQRPLDEIDQAIRRGQDSTAATLRGQGIYTPDSVNSIAQPFSRDHDDDA